MAEGDPVDANVVAALLGGTWVRTLDTHVNEEERYNITISPINGTWGTWLLGVRISWMTEAGEDSLEQTLQCVTGGVTVQGGEGEWEGMRATLELGVGENSVLRLHWFSSTGTPSESWEKPLWGHP